MRARWLNILPLLCLPLALSACGRAELLPLEATAVAEIRIDSYPEIYPSLVLTEEDEIALITAYLNGLTLVPTDKNPREYAGHAYALTLVMNDGATQTVSLSGNLFCIIDGKSWEIPYGEAIAFDRVHGQMQYRSYLQADWAYLTGTVISADQELSGATKLVLLQTEDGQEYIVWVREAYIIDARGQGSLRLGPTNRLAVFYEEQEGRLMAQAVVIVPADFELIKHVE